MVATRVKSWKEINDEIYYILRRSTKGLIESELTRPPLSANNVVSSFENCTQEEALKISRNYFRKWIYIIKDEVLFEKNKELEIDLKRVYDCDYGYYFTIQDIGDKLNIHLMDLETTDINRTIKSFRQILNKGPNELELIFAPKSEMSYLNKQLTEIMRSEMKTIRVKHKDFLIEQKKVLYTYIDSVTESVISKYKK